MGLFIGLQLAENDLKNIETFQQAIKLPNPVKLDEIHCTLFSTTDNFEYVSSLDLPIEIKQLTLGKIKTQTGIDCLVLYFNSQELLEYHDFIKDKYQVRPFYPKFIAHITLSYDCGDLDLNKVDLSKYIEKVTLIKEYSQELKFEVNNRKTVRE